MGSSENINIVDIFLIKLLALVSLHLQFFRLSYNIFAKTGQIGSSPEFLNNLVLNSFVDLNFASNLVWLEAILDFVFFMKVVLLYFIFPMV